VVFEETNIFFFALGIEAKILFFRKRLQRIARPRASGGTPETIKEKVPSYI
jgi:hypothetical protein